MEVSSCPTLPLSWVPNCPVPNCPVSKCPVPSCPVSSCPGFNGYRLCVETIYLSTVGQDSLPYRRMLSMHASKTRILRRSDRLLLSHTCVRRCPKGVADFPIYAYQSNT